MAMPLFHPRIIEKHIKTVKPASSEHLSIVTAWAENVASGIYNSETKNDGQFIQRILVELLGYRESNAGSPWTVQKNQPVGKGNVDVALGSFTADTATIIAPFELKGAKTRDLDAVMAGRNKSPVQQAWEYAMDAKGAKWVLVSNYREIRLYAVGYGRKDYERFDLTQLAKPEQYARLMLLLSAENLLGERTFGLLKESENKDKEITDKLYQDYKTLRSRMIEMLTKDNPSVPVLDIIQHTQTILDRILFVAFAEDRGLLPDDTLKRAYDTRNEFNPQPVWGNFKGLFQAIDKGSPPLNITGYNGGLFANNDQLNDLFLSDALCEGFRKIGEYDFDSDVSVNILGHIFEQSITDLEEIKANASGAEDFDKKKSKRKKDGIFYTPPYITRYIVEQAVGGWLNDRKQEIGFDKLPVLTDEDYDSIKVVTSGRGKNKTSKLSYNKAIEKHITAWESYKEALSNIKVLDPACGSGAFLNEVFDYLYREGQAVNGQLTTLHAENAKLFRWDKHILANNIYGVDINQESVEITKLSLWLKTANKGEKLTYLDNNIKCGNSLVDDPAIAGAHAFKWESEFADIMKAGGFDVVVGNPPYGASFSENEKDYFRHQYSEIHMRTPESFNYFIHKASQLSHGYVGFIIPSSYLTQHEFSKSRDYLIKYKKLSRVINLGDGVFEDVATPTCILLWKSNLGGQAYYADYRNIKRHELSTKIFEQNSFTAINKDLKAGGSFAFSNNKALIEKCFKHRSLKEVAEEVATGISSGLDSAYVVNPAQISKLDLEQDLLKKLVVGGEVNRFCIAPESGKKIIYLTAEDRLDNYPNISRSLQPYKEQLIKRREAANGKIPWFALNWPRRRKLFDSPKIVIRQTASRIMASFDTDAWYCLKSVILVQLPSPTATSYLYLLALLNSKLMDFIYQDLVGEQARIFPEVKPVQLFKLPIKEVDKKEQQPLIDKAKIMLAENKKLYELSSKFFALLKSEFTLEKPSTKLEQWYTLTFAEFTAELAKKKIALTVAQKAEWMEHFEKQKAIANAIKVAIDTTDHEIDQMVYALYALTPEEIAIVEGGAQ